jgi:hypothetical protein
MTETQKPKQNTYDEARRLAWDALAVIDPAEIAARSLTEIDGVGRIKVPFLADIFLVDLAGRKVLFENELEVYPFLSVLILHYLVGASDAGLAEEWISFREFEGGDVYFGSFTDRSLVPLKRAFGDNPDLLLAAAEPLGFEPLGFEPLEFGDVGVRIPVFPKVPLGVVVWRGDDEFSPEVNILFDKTANSILRTEDLAICGALTISKLRKNAEKISASQQKQSQ